MDARDSPAQGTTNEKYVSAMRKREGQKQTMVLKSARRLDSIQLDAKDKTYFTDEGYLVDHPILTSCGIFEYTNPDGTIRRELRLPEHVFDPESLKSYRGRPIIITHEAGAVDKDNVSQEQIGTILSDGYRDGDDVRAEIIIHDTDKMKTCGLRELSLGYTQTPIEEPGEWKGQQYDAKQTNIRINHLALVAHARAGEQARLNIDSSDEPELKGGKIAMEEKKTSDAELTPEQMEEAIALWKAKNATDGESVGDKGAKAGKDAKGTKDGADQKAPAEKNDGDKPAEKPAPTAKTPGGVEEKLAVVRDRRDRRDADGAPSDLKGARGVIAQQDEDLDTLTACLEMLLAEKAKQDSADCGDKDCKDKKDCAENEDCSGASKDGADDKSGSMNADSADEMIRQRLSICRVGDKLNMDGLEGMSIMDAKKAIIAKVLPGLRLDGRSDAYVDASYDLAVGKVNERKGVEYQRSQMYSGTPSMRNDGDSGTCMAAQARQRMLDREGGNQ